MADQQVRYVVYIDGTQRAEAELRSMETSANRAERSITSLNNSLKNTAGSLGGTATSVNGIVSAMKGTAAAFAVSLSAHGLINFAKDAVQGAADYETAVKRIKFASSSMEEGAKNISFIREEAEKFRIPLQEATDDYGKFLAMLAGSDLAGDKVRELHDNLLTIAKIKGLDAGQLSAGVMNLGKMIEAGGMDARHLRPLEMQLSGIGQYIAKLMGTTVHGLAEMRNKGKLSAADPSVLVEAVAKQAKDLSPFLDESLNTVRSEITDVNNAWLDFKNNLVFTQTDEIKDLFQILKDGIGFLSENKEQIIGFSKTLLDIGKAWAVYKTAMVVANWAYAHSVAADTTATAAATTAANAQTAALTREAEVVAALTLEYDALVVSMSGIYGAEKAAMFASAAATAGMPINMSGVAARGAAASRSALSGAGATFIRGAIPVAITYFAAEALGQMSTNATKEGYKFNKLDYFSALSNPFNGDFDTKRSLATIQDAILNTTGNYTYSGAERTTDIKGNIDEYFEKENVSGTIKDYFKNIIPTDKRGLPVSNDSTLMSVLSSKGIVFPEQQQYERQKYDEENYTFTDVIPGVLQSMGIKRPYGLLSNPYGSKEGKKGAGENSALFSDKDKVTGQRVITYNISIREINGIKENTVQAGGKMDPKQVAEIVRDEIIGALHDSQIRGGQ